MRFTSFAETFMEIAVKDGNSPGELKQKRWALQSHLLEYFGELDLDEIDVPHVREFTAMKVADGLAAKTINNLLTHLARYLLVARAEKARKENPPPIRRLALGFVESRYLKPEEAKAILTASKRYGLETGSSYYHPMIGVALNTGLRIGEILGLQWQDVDLANKRLHIRRSWCRVSEETKLPKNGHHRAVSLNPDAARIFETLLMLQGIEAEGSETRVFPVRYMAAHRGLLRVCEMAGIKDVGWHTLRHTYASWLVTKGVPLFIVSRLLGHQSMRVTERYAHLNAEANQAAVSIISNIMEEVK